MMMKIIFIRDQSQKKYCSNVSHICTEYRDLWQRDKNI